MMVPKVLQRRARRRPAAETTGSRATGPPNQFERMPQRDRDAYYRERGVDGGAAAETTTAALPGRRRGTPAELAWLADGNAALSPPGRGALSGNVLADAANIRAANKSLSQRLVEADLLKRKVELQHSAECDRWRAVQEEQTMKFKALTDELVASKRESVEAMLALNGDRRSSSASATEISEQLRAAVVERDALRLECAAAEGNKRQWARDLAEENTQLRALFDEVRATKMQLVADVNALQAERARLHMLPTPPNDAPTAVSNAGGAAGAVFPRGAGRQGAEWAAWRRLSAVCNNDQRRARIAGRASETAINAFGASIESTVNELRERHRRESEALLSGIRDLERHFVEDSTNVDALADEYANLLPNAMSASPSMTVDTQARDRELANMLQVARGEASRAKVELEHLRSILPSEEVEAKSDVDARIAMIEQDCQDQLAAFKQKLTRANKLNKVLQEALRSGAIKTDAAMKWQRAAARATNT